MADHLGTRRFPRHQALRCHALTSITTDRTTELLPQKNETAAAFVIVIVVVAAVNHHQK
jgi:hypothetical protein